MILDHVDLRVRDRATATAFYDAFLSVLGGVKSETTEFTTWRVPPAGGSIDNAPDSFGITEDPEHVPGEVRIAFKASTRETVDAVVNILATIGARNIEMDDGIYGDDVYAVFFDDPDGNHLEVTVTIA